MKTIDLSDLKAGDKAWSAQIGDVKVVHCHDKSTYPIEIEDKSGYYYTYTFSGYQKKTGTHPTLFHSEQEFREYWGMESNTLTKREQFAMAFVQPMMSNPSWEDYELEEMIKTALIVTDALLTKLNEKP
jgi:hypothetical protein